MGIDVSLLLPILLGFGVPIAAICIAKLVAQTSLYSLRRVRSSVGGNAQAARARASNYTANRLATAHRAGYTGAAASNNMQADERRAYNRGRTAGRADRG